MKRWKLTIEYDGQSFCGWQIQNEGPSVQQAFEDAVFKFSGERVKSIVAGRTDAGVHALGQVAHIDLERETDGFTVQNAINAHLRPLPISVLKVEEVNNEFSARLSAIKRHYIYRLINRKADLALDRGRAWRVSPHLDEDKMREAAQHLIGRHDFSSFRITECQAKSPVRTLDQLDVVRNGDEIIFTVNARSFLHHQVRNMVGTLAEVGRNLRRPEEMPYILEQKQRAAAGAMAPADGLYLTKIDYD